VRALRRRLRDHVLQCRLDDDVSLVRVGRGARGAAAADQRHRDSDPRRRRRRDARQHHLPEHPGAESRISEGLEVEPRLPPWWLDEAGEVEEAPPLEGDLDADVVVVGGGYTGLWTALAVREREPSARVVVLEAETCGAGPSGRNGGFCHGYWSHFTSLREVLGDADALSVARLADRIIPAVRALDDDVWLRQGGYLKVSAAPAQD